MNYSKNQRSHHFKHSTDEKISIIGNNYLAYILGLSQLDNYKDVSIIEDSTLGNIDHYESSISEIEYRFIENWLKKFKVTHLHSSDVFITPVETFFYLKNKRLTLGPSSFNNLIELNRKFPNYFIPFEKPALKDSR